MAKYRDLYRAAELTADYEKLIAWQALSRSAKQALYANHKKQTARVSVKRVPGYIRIFGSPAGLVVIQKRVPTLISQPQTGTEALITTLMNIANATRVPIVPPTDANINILTSVKKFKFAKLSCITVLGQSQATGRVIGVGYTKVNTDTVSTPFGRGTVTETYTAAVAAIKASEGYLAFIDTASPSGTLSSNKVVIYPEAGTA